METTSTEQTAQFVPKGTHHKPAQKRTWRALLTYVQIDPSFEALLKTILG
ncbi:hypothetical protein GO003_007475 [Methylicorpusculum oleiharenae]|nr:hypothetical protein [Methylicorpusculum oleiharenae]MCD2450222.1 hypothetical protein [Methylicorpusculum oleiharenae]